MTTQHTPGPWHYIDALGQVLSEQAVRVASVDAITTDDGRANARLIAAAPELLNRLEWAIEKLRECGQQCEFTLGMWRSVADCEQQVAKVKGNL